MNTLRVYRILKKTAMSGPGARYSIWVQGCDQRCKGCAAPETWPHDGGSLCAITELARDILSVEDIEGVTFLGGEPFLQASALAQLAKTMQENGLSVVTFTGFLLQDLLLSEEDGVKELLEATDLLIDGPFRQEEFDLSRPWVGSANQKYHFLTPRYAWRDIEDIPNQVEVRISPNGKVLVNGMGDFGEIKHILEEHT